MEYFGLVLMINKSDSELELLSHQISESWAMDAEIENRLVCLPRIRLKQRNIVLS